MLSLLKDLDKYEVILASASPRRFELLNKIGLTFKVRPSNVEEDLKKASHDPAEYAMQIAKQKAKQILNKYPGSLIISADTIVILDDQIIEKPQDERHAFEILRKLNGRTHQVITAFGFIYKNNESFSYEKSAVTFRRLTHQEIKAYISTGESLDKAGAYGAQGYGALLIEKIDGCYFNVVGLPLSSFFSKFDKFLSEL